jgi:hypothetical protein
VPLGDKHKRLQRCSAPGAALSSSTRIEVSWNICCHRQDGHSSARSTSCLCTRIPPGTTIKLSLAAAVPSLRCLPLDRAVPLQWQSGHAVQRRRVRKVPAASRPKAHVAAHAQIEGPSYVTLTRSAPQPTLSRVLRKSDSGCKWRWEVRFGGAPGGWRPSALQQHGQAAPRLRALGYAYSHSLSSHFSPPLSHSPTLTLAALPLPLPRAYFLAARSLCSL